MSTPEEGYGPPESPYVPPGQGCGGPGGGPGGGPPLPQPPSEAGPAGYMRVPSGYPTHALPGNPGQEIPSFAEEMGPIENQIPHPGQFHYYPQQPVNYGPRFYPGCPPSHGLPPPQHPPHPPPPGFAFQGPPPNPESGQPRRFPGPMTGQQRMARPPSEHQRHVNPRFPMHQGMPMAQTILQMGPQQNLMPVPAGPNTSFQPGMPPNQLNPAMRAQGLPPQQIPQQQMPPQHMHPQHVPPHQ